MMDLNKTMLNSEIKLMFYGPTIHGLTTDNVVQFSIEITSRDLTTIIKPREVLDNVHRFLISRNFTERLLNKYKLNLETSYHKQSSRNQLTSDLLSLVPVSSSSPFKYGSRIFFTAGNTNKVLESILM